MVRTKTWAGLALCIAAAGCTTAPSTQSGFLSAYDHLTPQESLRAEVKTWRDEAALAGRAKAFIEPTVLKPAALANLTPEQAEIVRREVDQQLCLELSERFEIVDAPDAMKVRAAITDIAATNVAASLISAAASRTIPGPATVRVPLGLGGLSMEAEAIDRTTGVQLAAITWARRAQVVMDKGSLSPAGDAHQMAEPFGDAVGALVYAGDPNAPQRERPDGLCGAGIGAQDVGRFVAERALGLHLVDGGAP